LKLKNISNFSKKIILILSDLFIISFSIVAAYSLRLEKIYSFWDVDFRVYLIFYIIFFLVFYFLNIYQILLRFFDNFSIRKIINGIFIFQLVLILINFLVYNDIYFPRSVSFIAPILIGILVILHRIVLNYLINSKKKNDYSVNNILIYGVNENTVSLLKSLRQFSTYGEVKGFIDVDDNYKRRELNGIKIFKKNEIDKIIKNLKISEIIIGNSSISQKKTKKIFEKYENTNLRIRNINETENYVKNFMGKFLEPKINFHDIINRPKIYVDKKILRKKINKKNILVTGGGGSIGSALCFEILKHEPKKLFILDSSEINLFNFLNKVKNNQNYLKNRVKLVLGDCSDLGFLNNYFKHETLDEIYHAAAYKHVGFGEENPYSMIKNNVIGTSNLVNYAIVKKIKNFIFISSDKAVNPKSILGYTKKLGEIIINNANNQNKKNKINFTTVRFGNVIGSSGSVIPLFLKQISQQSSLTVTHKKVKRYFMSTSEAVQLVINSSYLNQSGNKIFALDMGTQIKIFDIAKRIIRLSGYTIKDEKNKKGDINIKFIGLNKGEKISEEISLGQNLKKTEHPKIFVCEEKINKNLEINIKIDNLRKILDSKNVKLISLINFIKNSI